MPPPPLITASVISPFLIQTIQTYLSSVSAQDVLQSLIIDCKADLYRLNGKSLDVQFNQNIAHEKWFWYLMKRDMMAQMRDPKAARDNARTAAATTKRLPLDEPQRLLSSEQQQQQQQHKKDFATLFPASLTSREGEMALVLWDFLDR